MPLSWYALKLGASLQPFMSNQNFAPFMSIVRSLRVGLLCPIGWALAFGTSYAQTTLLVPATRLSERVETSNVDSPVTHLSADQLTGVQDGELTLTGQAQLRRSGTVLKADTMVYDARTDVAKATGQVQINQAGNVVQGSELSLHMAQFRGYMLSPSYRIVQTGATGDGDRMDFQDQKHSTITNATYSTCRRVPGMEWLPDWVLRATRIEMDSEQDVGYAQGAVLRFKDIPLLALPSISFPLGNGRKTGFLSPSYSTDSLSGFELTTPFYWNISPDTDATVYPSLSTKRGLNMGLEWRYLTPNYGGQIRTDVMPNDRLRDDSRWGLATQHQQQVTTAYGKLELQLNINRVSDDNYWRDFPRASGLLAQRLLPNEGVVNWSDGYWSGGLKVSKWQVLQDASAPIVPPYDRLPQLNFAFTRSAWAGWNLRAETQLTRFQADANLTGQANGTRTLAMGEVSRPMNSPGFFVTPRLSLVATDYRFDTALGSGERRANLAIPTFSLDSGLVFDRPVKWFGREFLQTLEPRAFYVYTPYRDQSQLPNYDSAERDFNFSSLFTQNRYSGYSRIADSNLITLGVTSKLHDALTGGELARVGIAQRFRFAEQKVVLPGGTPESTRLSDLLLGGSVNIDPQWSAELAQQLDPANFKSTRATLGVQYSPDTYQVLNAAYRYQKDTSEQVEVSWQWPVSQMFRGIAGTKPTGESRWYSVGRLNFSVTDRKLVDSVIGFEYDAGCWVSRLVVENQTRSDATSNKRVLLQLDLLGFASLGSGTLSTLRKAIPRYQSMSQAATGYSRYSQYE